MNSDLVDVYVFSLFAMLNPSLLAAVTVMLLFPDPKRLMLGYLLGAYLTSITLGLVFVFALPGSSTENASKETIGPVEDLVVGLLLWTLAFVLATGRDRPFRERRAEKKEAKHREKEEAGKPTESLPLRLLGARAIPRSRSSSESCSASRASPTSTRSITSTASTREPSPPCCW